VKLGILGKGRTLAEEERMRNFWTTDGKKK
jgi:hypothetical protein